MSEEALIKNLPAPITDASVAARYWVALDRDDPVDEYTPLIPADECRAIVAELTASLELRADEHTAAKLTAALVGGYPHARPPEPAVYQRAIESVFRMFPADLGRQAVDVISLRLRFLPSRADVYDVLANLAAKRRIAIRRATAHLAEAARRAAEEEAARVHRPYRNMTPEEREIADRVIALARRGDAPAAPDARQDSGPRSLADVMAGRPAVDPFPQSVGQLAAESMSAADRPEFFRWLGSEGAGL